MKHSQFEYAWIEVAQKIQSEREEADKRGNK
jgi:hypothetical protein